MSLFPIFVKMTSRPALVVGGGTLAASKVEALLATGAQVTVVAPQVKADIADRQRRNEVNWVRRGFETRDVRAKAIVFAATGDRRIDRHVFESCRAAGVWCNAVDDPDYCDFYSPAIVRRGDLQLAISTNGQSPALAQQIRQELEERFGPHWGERVAELGRKRRTVLATTSAGPERTQLLHAQAREAIRTGDMRVLRRMSSAISKWLNTEDKRVPLI